MDLLEYLSDLPDHLVEEISLKIHPSVLTRFTYLFPNLIKNFEEKYYDQWYADTITLFKQNRDKGLQKMVELNYVDLLNEFISELKSDNLKFVLKLASANGNLKIVQMVLNRRIDVRDLDRAMTQAAKNGHLDVIDLLLNYNLQDRNTKEWTSRTTFFYDQMMKYAAYGGHKNIVEKMLELGANNYEPTMVWAASTGQIEIVKMMLARGAKNYEETMKKGAEGNSLEIVKMMLSRGAKNYDNTMIYAVESGNMDIVKLMVSLGVNQYTMAMEEAARKGHLEIIKFLLPLGSLLTPFDYYKIMEAAAKGHSKKGNPDKDKNKDKDMDNDRLEIIKLLFPLSSKFFIHLQMITKEAILSGQIEIVKFMFENGVINYDDMLTPVITWYSRDENPNLREKYMQIVGLLLEKGANYDKAINLVTKLGIHEMTDLIRSYRERS